jgi:hypothetical protein
VENPHGRFREDCSLCHDASAWKPARIGRAFDHAKYGFALEGAHAAATCVACHTTLDFTMERAICASCHEDVHRGEFGTGCERCHTARSFIDPAGMTRMHQATPFPLVGVHAMLECGRCHEDGVAGQLTFVGTTAECQGCHMNDYSATTDPAHAAGGFSTECASCHATVAWSPARFDHSATAFPLSGAHRALACERCHSDGVYAGKPTLCVSCHQADYDATTNPSHIALGFPADCASCHTTSGWGGATFNHDTSYFPIYSGRHAGIWTGCSTCHTVSTSYASFTCFSCHPHDDRAKTDADHAGRANYVYDSQACYTCHPQGRH